MGQWSHEHHSTHLSCTSGVGGGEAGGAIGEGGRGGEGGHAVIMLLRPANWNRRFPWEVAQRAHL